MSQRSRQLRKAHPKNQLFLDGVFDENELSEIAVACDDSEFESVDMDIDVDYRCPSCGYEWSGHPKPASSDDGSESES